MITCSVGKGDGEERFSMEDKNFCCEVSMKFAAAAEDPDAECVRALDNPVGSAPLEELVKGKKNVVIVTSDITRPMPSFAVLPAVMRRLNAAGIPDSAITIVLGVGSHRRHTDAEKKKLVGEDAFNRVPVIDSGTDGYIPMGVTAMGTPVEVDRHVSEADFRLCLGNVEFHYFAGYSGGAKAIMPGVCSRAAIQVNHSHMVDPAAVAGRIEGNPIREDIEAAVRECCPVDFILNVVLDEHKKIVKAVAGDVVKAHREACRLLTELYRIDIPARADIVIASQGGAPKDLNLYQLQKGLENAKYAVRDGGIVIMVGSCKEGMGEKTFEDWMVNAKKPDDLIERVQKDFMLGGHKAAAICMVLKRADIYLVSDMEPDFVRSIFMHPFSTVQEALDAAMAKQGADAQVIVMGHSGSTLPHAVNED